MNAHLLLVEDNESLGYILCEYLRMNNYRVTLARNGREGWKLFRNERFDLCVLDVMMPGVDGFTLAEQIKALNSDMPIIFLTAKSLKVDVLKGFRLGADDYIKKPVDEEELLARIAAVLARSKPDRPDDRVYTVGGYTFDVANQRLTFDGQDKFLTEMEAQLLQLLCEAKGNLLPRKKVLQDIWGKSDYFTRRSMDVFISKLRKYLAQDPQVEIRNVHGSGFILSDGVHDAPAR